MSLYNIQNQWGGNKAPWNPGGIFNIGNRGSQLPVALQIKSSDGGVTFSGTMTYAGEGPIGFRATLVTMNTYHVENQWGGPSAPWHDAGFFLLGARSGQNAVAFDLKSADNGKTLTGTMTYAGEGPIGVQGALTEGFAYNAANQWGGSSAPWHPGGQFVIGCRGDSQGVVGVNAQSTDGTNLSGSMTYAVEGPIGLTLKRGRQPPRWRCCRELIPVLDREWIFHGTSIHGRWECGDVPQIAVMKGQPRSLISFL